MKTTVPPPNASFLHDISDQLLDLTTRIEEDVARYADSEVGPRGAGFVIYYLSDQNGEPLKDVTAASSGISLGDILETRGFQQLRDFCEIRSMSVRIDEHFYANDPQPTKIFRIIVDGWQPGASA